MNGETTPAAPATPAATPTPAPSTPAPQPQSGGLRSLLPEAPSKRPAEPQQGAAPADPAAPAEPYEHPWLEQKFGGRFRKLDAVEEYVNQTVGHATKLDQQIRAMQAKNPLLKGPPLGEDGKPGPYEFQVGESMAAKGYAIDPSDPTLQAATAWGHKWSIPQEAMQELYGMAYEPMYEADADSIYEAESRRLLDYYGSAEAMVQGNDALMARLEEIMGEEARATIRRVCSSAETTEFLDRLMKTQGSMSLPEKPGAPGGKVDTEADILAMQNEDHNWRADPAKKARYDAWLYAEADRRDAAAAGRGKGPITEIRVDTGERRRTA